MPAVEAVKRAAMPAIISQLIVWVYHGTDTFYLGRGNNPYMIAGVSLVLPVLGLCLCLAEVVGTGTGTLLSQLLKGKRVGEIKKVSSCGLCLSAAMAVLISAIVFVGMEPVFRLLGASDNTLPYVRQYAFYAVVLGGIPMALSHMMFHLIDSIGASKAAGFGLILGGISNIVLDPIFMFVVLPGGSEVLGAGMASLTANCIMCAYFLYMMYFIRKKTSVSLWTLNGLPEKKHMDTIFRVGVVSVAGIGFLYLDYLAANRLIAAYGDIALGAAGIAARMGSLPLYVGLGICQGIAPVLALHYSSRNYERAFDIIKSSLKLGMLLVIPGVILYEIFAEWIVQAVILEPQALLQGTVFLRIGCLWGPFLFVNLFLAYVFQAFGEKKKSLLLSIVRWGVFHIPLLLLLNSVVGMYGTIWCFVCGDLLALGPAFRLYGRFTYDFRRINEADEFWRRSWQHVGLLVCLILFPISAIMLARDLRQAGREEEANKLLQQARDEALASSEQGSDGLKGASKASTGAPTGISLGEISEEEGADLKAEERQEGEPEAQAEEGAEFSEEQDKAELPVLAQYAPLLEQNRDLAGWLKVEDTVIDYPVMYTPQEPEYYLHRAFDGSKSFGGSLFVGEDCQPEGAHVIIYGHHMRNGTMFGSLPGYASLEYAKKHPVIRYDTLYEEKEYEVLAAFYSKIYAEDIEGVFRYYWYTDLSREEVFNRYIKQVKAAALYDTGVEADYGDEILTLSTCSYHTDDGRFVVVARRKNA